MKMKLNFSRIQKPLLIKVVEWGSFVGGRGLLLPHVHVYVGLRSIYTGYTCIYNVHVLAMGESIQCTVLYVWYSTFDDVHVHTHVHTYRYFQMYL